tara:strand:+ start:1680 stop:2798 length:1119 start_codon:yes stop_codon:yes gene_type:complete
MQLPREMYANGELVEMMDTETLEAGAPNLRLRGDMTPQPQPQMEMEMESAGGIYNQGSDRKNASAVWNNMDQGDKEIYDFNFEIFFQSGDWMDSILGMGETEEMDRMPAAMGGIMDLDAGRQGYKFGKFVRKITKAPKKIFKKTTSAIKKIAKSPIGKLALAAGLGYLGTAGIGSIGSGQTPFLKRFSPEMFKKGLTKMNPIRFLGQTNRESKFILPKAKPTATKPSIMRDLALIGIPSIVAGAYTAAQPEEDLEMEISERRGTDDVVAPVLANLPEFRFLVEDEYVKSADGGRINKAGGGIMNMGGMEMDLRGGGFVPMGRAEKADDVPARLSKNEFVFTADAVRAAGGGDVDRGADKMYNTMKQLESRVV